VAEHAVLIIEVEEFDEIPVICSKPLIRADGHELVSKATILVRSTRKHETCSVTMQTELRELITLATEKMLRRTMGMLSRADVAIQPAQDPFEVERGDEL
jgi:hypothetical protein